MRLATVDHDSEIFPAVLKDNIAIRMKAFKSLRSIDFSSSKCLLPLIQGTDEKGMRLFKQEFESISDETLSAMIKSGDAFNLKDVKLQAPILRPPSIFCLGFNYRSHAPELKRPIPEVPVIFMKPSKAIVGPHGNIILPKVASRVDYEVELTVVMGRGGRYIRREEAYSTIFGYTVLNDITARDVQQNDFSLARPWLRSKGFDTFAPIGPIIVTGDEIGNPMDLELKLSVNGGLRQCARTGEMIFDVLAIVEWISSFTTLEPGALIVTGTPEKIGQLHGGDVVEAYVEKIGTLSNHVEEEK